MSKDIPTKGLFPAPSSAASAISPYFWPGIGANSTEALQHALTDNHNRWHVYFNDKGFHNHASHFVIALWALGADGSIIEAAYKLDSEYLLPALKSPEPITSRNWVDHLGDERYYNAYLKFFTGGIHEKDPSALLEEFIFASTANFETTHEEKHPEMLNRFLSGLLHPLIHVGYGLQFGLPGMVVEGLASAAVHHATSTVLVPPYLFKPADIGTLESQLLPALRLEDKDRAETSGSTHAFTILARILKDPQFDGRQKLDELQVYQDVMKNHGEGLRKYVDEWSVNGSDPNEVERKIEELVWTNTIIYGIPGWEEGEDYNADFFHMHLVTSSIFLSSLVGSIKPSSKELLLRSYFAVCLGWWIARGRPGFDIEGFFSADTAYPVPSGPLPTPDEKTLPSQSSPKAITPNPWLPIIQTAMVHHDEHLPKLQRALAHFATVYGSRVSGLPDFRRTELPCAEKLDGTLFLRAAGLTAKRMGRVREGEKPLEFWDRKGFFNPANSKSTL